MCDDLLRKVARSREAEVEACGRATGLQFAVEALRAENHSLRQTNEMLIGRAFGSTSSMPAQGPAYSSALPPMTHGVPLGSPRPALAFDPGLPPVPPAPQRDAAAYALGGMDSDPFQDIGDDAAARLGIRTDETTGALEGGPSLPMQGRTQ